MPDPTPTIVDAKQTFLRSQIRLLSAPIQPSPTWQQDLTSRNPTNDDPAPIPEKATTDLVAKVNAKIKSHNRLVFSAPSQRHVAEQIDALYWNEVTAEGRPVNASTIWVPRGADLAETSVLAGLPETLDGLGTAQGDGEGRRRYEAVREEALGLARRRDELRRKLDGYRRLRELLVPFENVKGGVQPNLVGRDGELAREMERMRVLIARVVGGLGEGNTLVVGRRGVERDDDGSVVQRPVLLSDREKLARVMELG